MLKRRNSPDGLPIPKAPKHRRMEKPDAVLRDKPYKDSANGRPCDACGAQDGTVVGAHMRWGNEGGTSFKPGDDLLAFLCFNCHADQEAHPGPGWWCQHVLKRLLRQRHQAWKAA